MAILSPNQLYAYDSKSVERINQAVKTVEAQGVVRGRSGPIDPTIYAAETEAIYNLQGAAMVEGGLCHLYEYDLDNFRFNVRLPLQPAVAMFGIIAGDVANTTEGGAFVAGERMVLVDPTEIANVTVGSFLGLKAGSHLAIPSHIDWMVVLKVLQPPDVASERAIVEIRRNAGWRF